MNRKTLLFFSIIFIVIILLFLFLIIFSVKSPENRNNNQNISPIPTQGTIIPNKVTPAAPQAKPVLISELPRNGFAILTTTPEVINSEREITKLRSDLPFIRDLSGVNRRKISIVIPGAEYQDDPWKLTVQIFGPDYQITSTSSNYQIEKALFIQGANTVFSWIRENGADSNKIIIKWGDQAFIQQRAEQWIAE